MKWKKFSEELPEYGSHILVCTIDKKFGFTTYTENLHRAIKGKLKENEQITLYLYKDEDVFPETPIDQKLCWLYPSDILPIIGECS